jgi:hypothetical protein
VRADVVSATAQAAVRTAEERLTSLEAAIEQVTQAGHDLVDAHRAVPVAQAAYGQAQAAHGAAERAVQEARAASGDLDARRTAAAAVLADSTAEAERTAEMVAAAEQALAAARAGHASAQRRTAADEAALAEVDALIEESVGPRIAHAQAELERVARDELEPAADALQACIERQTAASRTAEQAQAWVANVGAGAEAAVRVLSTSGWPKAQAFGDRLLAASRTLREVYDRVSAELAQTGQPEPAPAGDDLADLDDREDQTTGAVVPTQHRSPDAAPAVDSTGPPARVA